MRRVRSVGSQSSASSMEAPSPTQPIGAIHMQPQSQPPRSRKHPARKRRRIEEVFSSLSLTAPPTTTNPDSSQHCYIVPGRENSEGIDDEANGISDFSFGEVDASQEQEDDGFGGYLGNSSRMEEEISMQGDGEDAALLATKEAAYRLVFGPRQSPTSCTALSTHVAAQDPVDRKLESLIRQSRLHAQQQEQQRHARHHSSSPTPPSHPMATRDDFHLSKSSNTVSNGTVTQGKRKITPISLPPSPSETCLPSRPRSQSLPRDPREWHPSSIPPWTSRHGSSTVSNATSTTDQSDLEMSMS
eukprot:CAMPEP_0198290858 /NCGR_PEP_ID=MMETSP1449-20131203/8568_1 /TAXON_ID=420275 /ORGANISM="Attheya septentrionalis, Strain CCMP2084" /LENGTH=300 /DNA_ID=CAMNT_0043989407 /DNA_START=243 /DNA_END=1145 /DNA_ORIENTATION=+